MFSTQKIFHLLLFTLLISLSFSMALPNIFLGISLFLFLYIIIKKENEDLCFIDFEYFGYDDPVKLISDFYYHPGMNLNGIQKKYWLKQTFEIFDEEVFLRANLCKPLYGLIWCLIILNDFRPEILERRMSATTQNNIIKSKLLNDQLNKAKSLLNIIKIEEKIN